MWNYLIVFGALCLGLCAGQTNYKQVTVHGQGSVRGTLEGSGSSLSRPIISFRGIPYARPLNQTHRFKPPEEPDRFDREPFDAMESRPCPQMSPFEDDRVIGQEDCLTLDVHTSFVQEQNQQPKQLPVVVYFPGGRFRHGSSATFGPKYLVDESVLVVVNYRLGALGFLSTEDSASPGNYGLMDQQMALDWVKRNIGQFSGDPNKITLFGHDSGAVSISLHLLRSNLQVNQAALSGGSFLNPWAFQHHGASRHADHLARRLGCGDRSNRAMIDCLKRKTAQEIVQETGKFRNITFLPVADKNFTDKPFLEDDPIRMLKERKNSKGIPLLLGMTKDGGSFEFYDHYPELMLEQDPLTALTRYFQPYLFPQTVFGSRLLPWQRLRMESVVKSIIFAYFKNVEPLDWFRSKPNWIEALSDFMFRSGLAMFGQHLNRQDQNLTYMYQFEYVSPYSYGQLVRNSQSDPSVYGAAHMDDSLFFFNTSFDSRLTQKINLQTDLNYLTTFRNAFRNILLKFTKDGNLDKVQNQGVTITGQWNPYGTNESALRFYKFENSPGSGFGTPRLEAQGQFRSHHLHFFSSFVPDLLLDNSSSIFYEHQELNQHYKSATWGLLGFAIVLFVVILGLVAFFVVKKRRENERHFQKLTHAAPPNGP